jgi:hypothetical protein
LRVIAGITAGFTPARDIFNYDEEDRISTAAVGCRSDYQFAEAPNIVDG